MTTPASTLPSAASMRSPGPRLLHAVRIVHPFPTLLNVAATAMLAFVAVGGVPPAWLLSRMLLTMLFAQCAIGVVNDICDEALDASAKPWKPIPAGLVSRRVATVLAAALIAAAAALASTLGLAGFLLAMLGLSCGLAYDIWLKRSILSAVPFMVAIPTLPLWVWATLDEWQDELLWVIPLGALIGLSLHLANTLPDIDDDRAFGVEGLAHRLGARGSMVVGWGSFAGALALSVLIAPLVGYDARTYALTLAIGVACLGASAAVFALGRGASLRLGFGILAVGAALLAVGWLAALG